MKTTPGYGDHHMLKRMNAQERHAMGKSFAPQSKGPSKGATGNMKTVKRVAGGKVNSK